MSIHVSGRVRALFALFALFSLSCAGLDAQSPPPREHPARAHRLVSTSDVGAQAAFDDGLTLLYAFNPEEARRAFALAAKDDAGLAMAWWGIAMTYGPNINTSYDAGAQRRGREASAKARLAADRATPVERAFIAAAEKRFAYFGEHDAERSARAYRDAMNGVAAVFTADDDAQALAAEAGLDVHPWEFVTKDGQPTAGTAGSIARLRTVLARNPWHLGANHFIIHALEESAHPGEAVDAARRLAALDFEPGAEHLAHMPAHAFMRVGDYRAAGEANAKAVELYRAYLAQDPAGHADYYGHDCLFGVDAFMMAGEYRRARVLAAACKASANVMLARVDLRFRRYDALAQDPDAGFLAAGMSAVSAGRVDGAESELAKLRKADDAAGKISADVLAAAIARARGEGKDELAALERAVALQDAQGYSEPPAFWYPVRESLGGALLRAGRADAAERVFRADLARDPVNPRSLFGLAEALARDGATSEANEVRAQFARAWPEAEPAPALNDL
ncbi:MAG: hypothetical protein M3R53_02695 [Candidatus Eremiobacteraeota bacterium]|nr:hypothetical protein [Candidatus Eremiobacteraeota bacterium]